MKTLIKLLALLAPLGASAQLTLETETSWNGSDYIHPFGESNTATYGQTFLTDGINLSLNTIEFHLASYEGADDVDFSVFVTAWDDVNNRATGPILYQSGVQSLAVGSDWTEFTLSTGGTALAANEDYVFFLNASNEFNGLAGTAKTGGAAGDPYADGRFMYLNNGANFNSIFSSSWSSYSINDMAFRLEFSELPPVPEPSTIGFLSMGALGMILYMRRRLRSKGIN